MSLKIISVFISTLLLLQLWFPTIAWALTGGPTQPEFTQFAQVGSNDNVNHFTGDFNYNIPLFEMNGYPITLNYQSDPKMEEEASWVGLGWTLNPGSINREVRGVPDDFDGEEIVKEYNLKGETTFGVEVSPDLEVFGLGTLGVRGGVFYNTRRGPGVTSRLNAGIEMGSFSVDGNVSFNSQQGIDLGLIASYKGDMEISQKQTAFKSGLKGNLNSRSGLNSLLLNGGIRSGKIGKGTELSFLDRTIIPTNQLPVMNKGFNFSGKVGVTLVGFSTLIEISGYYQKQDLLFNSSSHASYGYLNLQNSDENPFAIQDANISAEYRYRNDMPNIPISYGTYDIFSVNGHGVGGSYRAFRNDRGVFSPTAARTQSGRYSLGVEFGGGFIFKSGVNAGKAIHESTRSKWDRNNRISSRNKFREKEKDYEPFYFKDVGESVVYPEDNYNVFKNEYPINVGINKELLNISASGPWTYGENFSRKGILPAESWFFESTERIPRAKPFSFLTGKEAAILGVDKDINSYKPTTDGFESSQWSTMISSDFTVSNRVQDAIPRDNEPRSNHLSEITITKEDGMRYVYGIPAYNEHRKEVSFNVNAGRANGKLVGFNASDASTANSQGKDHYFKSKTLPSYAHSYLLTAILPPEYQDVEPNRISYNDPGQPVKFNYTKVEHGDENLYKWRLPIHGDSAFYQQNFHSHGESDMGHYSYGEKEIWILHSIETKNEIAFFYTSERNDALGVDEELGSISNNFKLLQLDRIDIYEKFAGIEYFSNEFSLPKKSIHFEYDYELCPGVPNNVNQGEGKLTLEKVWFTHFGNDRAKLNPYEFEYKTTFNESEVFSYDPNNTDRWGNYKTQENELPSNQIYPYSHQNQILADSQAGAWNLNKIKLPSGASMEVVYESDSYSYVQDKRAGEMFPIAGFLEDEQSTDLQSELYDNGLNPNRFIAVEINPEFSNLNEFRERYLKDLQQLYVKSRMDLTGNGDWEYISGYLSFNREATSIRTINDKDYLLIEVEPIEVRRNNLHPLTNVGMQLLRLSIPELAYPNFEYGHGGDVEMSLFGGLISEIKDLISGFESNRMKEDWCRYVDLDNSASWIRLSNPTFEKFGGGSRVAEVRLSDAWTHQSGLQAHKYGQKYYYTTQHTLGTGETIEISSGVASYEPQIGGEENLMRNAMPYKEEVKLGSDNFHYTEKPVGESLYPSPVVGYSKVRVESITAPDSGISGTGFTVYEYYTAKDFPVKEDLTGLSKELINPSPIIKLFNLTSHYKVGVSQGISIEVNDMHGKLKRMSQYNDEGSLLSFDQHNYFTKEKNGERVLKNEVPVVSTNGSIEQQIMGVDIDIWNFMSEEKSVSINAGVDPNLDLIPLFFAVLPLPIGVVKFQKSMEQYRAAQTTKFIHRKGVLKEIVSMKEGSTISRQNVAFDETTGQALVIKTQNEYNDPIFEFSYPAYWTLNSMRPAYENIGSVFNNIQVDANGRIDDFTEHKQFFTPGDELLVYDHGDDDFLSERFYIGEPGGSASNYSIIDPNGHPLDQGQYSIKIIRSGKRNLLTAPAASVRSLDDPVVNGTMEIQEEDAILDYRAMVYDDNWLMSCQVTEDTSENLISSVFEEGVYNPYVRTRKGVPRLHSKYFFSGNRSNSSLLGSPNLRDEGALIDFQPFWVFEEGSWSKDTNEWVTEFKDPIYDTHGNLLEYRNALDIPFSSLYSARYSVPGAVVENATYSDIGFLDFENYFTEWDNNFDIKLYTGAFPQKSHSLGFLNVHSGSSKHYTESSIQNNHWNILSNINNNCPLDDSVAMGLITPNVYYSTCSDCIQPFTPIEGNTYHFSCWVATDSSRYGKALDSLSIQVTIGSREASGPGEIFVPETDFSFYPFGPMVDGWQQITGRFTIPITQSPHLKIELTGYDYFNEVSMDDFRIHFIDASMNTFVYSPFTKNLVAQLDDNNYATFFEYDENGALIRTKRETERGIITVMEGKNHFGR